VQYNAVTVYIGNYIFASLIQVTTKTTRSIMATVLEKALTAINVVLSSSVLKEIIEIIIITCDLNLI
jgi:hypothetical protein